MNKLLIFFFTPVICWSQEVGVKDYVTAFDDVDDFTERFFKAYPFNSEIEPHHKQ